jgi:hypothetical protein
VRIPGQLLFVQAVHPVAAAVAVQQQQHPLHLPGKDEVNKSHCSVQNKYVETEIYRKKFKIMYFKIGTSYLHGHYRCFVLTN